MTRSAVKQIDSMRELSLAWGACALATHAGTVVREFDTRLGGKAHELVRRHLRWENVLQAVTSSELSRRRRATWEWQEKEFARSKVVDA